MPPDIDPTEGYDGRITVRLLDDEDGTEAVACSSFEKAIEIVKENRHSVTATKIIDRDGDVVFTSANTDIDTWEKVWKDQLRSLSVEVEEYDCPYDDIACFADDLCVQCKMDKLQNGVK